MGWDYTNRPKGISNLEWFRSMGWSDGYELLDGMTVGGVFYGALRLPDGNVTATVSLIRWVPADYFNFGKKDMSEDMGPYEAHCPARILDMLTEPQSDYAAEWRAKCRQNLARAAEARKVKPGRVVVFAQPVKFTNGDEMRALEFVKGNTFRRGYTRYTVTGWRRNEFEVFAPGYTPEAAEHEVATR